MSQKKGTSKRHPFGRRDRVGWRTFGSPRRPGTTLPPFQPPGLAITAKVNAFDALGVATSLSANVGTSYANDILVAVVSTYNFVGSGAVVTSTVTDSAGLTWHLRSRTNGVNGVSFSLNQEVWWALAATPVGTAVTATFSATPSQASSLTVFAVSGSPNPSAPWDASGTLPALQSHMTGVNAAMSQSGVTSSTKAMLFAFVSYANNGHGNSTDPAGFTAIEDIFGNSLSVMQDFKLLTAAGSNVPAWGVNQDYFQIAIDALTGDVVAGNGDATGSLLIDTTSISVSGTATGDASTGNALLTDTTTISVSGSAGVSATANGDLLTVTTSLTAGSDAVSEEPALFTVTTSVISGSASVSSTAAGSLLTDTVSLPVTGTATGGSVASGVLLTDTVSIISGTASVSTAPALLTVTTSLIDGTETGDAVADGSLITLTTSLIVGEVDITEPGDTGEPGGGSGFPDLLMVTVSLISGTAFQEAADGEATGTTLEIDVSLIEGAAFVDAQADGDTVTVATSLIDGVADPGALFLTIGIELIPGQGVGDGSGQFAVGGGLRRAAGGNPFVRGPVILNATAEGALLERDVEFYPGTTMIEVPVEVIREVIKYVTVEAPSIVVPGSNVTNVVATGNVVAQIIALASGSANGDAIAFGQLVEDGWDWGPHNERVLEGEY